MKSREFKNRLQRFGALARTVTGMGVLTLSLTNCLGIPSAAEVAQELSRIANVQGTRGQVNLADGSPLSGAFVAITSESDSSDTMALGRLGRRGVLGLATNAKGQYLQMEEFTDDEGHSCEDLSEALSGVIATDCTGADGTYDISADDLPCDEELTIIAKKGSFTLSVSVTLSCDDDVATGSDDYVEFDDFEFDEDCGLDESSSDEYAYLTSSARPAYTMDSSTCQFDEARMAVVTGNYDEIQNVLAKLGFGEVNESGLLDTSAEFDFELIDGNDSLPDGEYMNIDEFLSEAGNLDNYDIIFFNCGVNDDELSQDPEILANLQAYVEEGGRLYATDWSFNFVEDPFPSFLDFYNDEENPEQAEDHHSAKIGEGGQTVDADVQNDELGDWLDEVAVNDGEIEVDCYAISDDEVNARTGARNDDGTVTIGDFLGSWVVIDGEHAGYEGEADIWMSGVISTYEGVADKPLTVTKDVGDGRLLYSSYHTAHDCPTTGFWAQERILQYLVFEM